MESTVRAVLYARVSTEDQAQTGYSLPSQIEKCREYAEERGWIVVDVIRDEGVSGAKLDRPGLDQIRQMADQDDFEALVVYDLDRFSRDRVHLLLLEDELRRAGVRVHYVLGNYEDTPEGGLFKDIRASFAEFERAKIKQRTMSGRRAKARAGRVIGHGRGTYGYDYEDDQYLINESQARVVRQIYEFYLEGESMHGIVRRLEEMGIPSWNGTRKWARSSVGKILANETYAGTIYHNRYDTLDGKVHTPRPKEEWIPVSVPAIVDRDVWEAVQAQRERRQKRVKRRPRRQYLLRGVLRCAECDLAYSGDHSKGNRYYRDGGRKHRSLRADCTEDVVWEGIYNVLSQEDHLLAAWKEEQAKGEQVQNQIRTKIEDCAQLHAKTVRKIESLTHTYIDPDVPMTKEEYVRVRKEIQTELDGLDERCNELRKRLAAADAVEEKTETLKRFAAAVRGKLDSPSWETKRKLVELLELTGYVEWIEDDVAKVKIEGHIPTFEVGLSSPIPEDYDLLRTLPRTPAWHAPAPEPLRNRSRGRAAVTARDPQTDRSA